MYKENNNNTSKMLSSAPSFKITEFMQQENFFFNDNGWFYHNMFYNDFYVEPVNKKEPE